MGYDFWSVWPLGWEH